MNRRIVILFGVALIAAPGCAKSSSETTPEANGGVAVGYGEQSKEKVTGAVGTVSGGEISGRPLKVEELLRGKVSGLQVITKADGTVTFRLRGGNPTMSADVTEAEPLVVVDGVQIQSNAISSALAGFLPEDIKNVSVLKDVASTSIYGTRGAAGVILITTKRGK